MYEKNKSCIISTTILTQEGDFTKDDIINIVSTAMQEPRGYISLLVENILSMFVERGKIIVRGSYFRVRNRVEV